VSWEEMLANSSKADEIIEWYWLGILTRNQSHKWLTALGFNLPKYSRPLAYYHNHNPIKVQFT